MQRNTYDKKGHQFVPRMSTIKAYCEKSNLLGLQYIVDSHRPIIERLLLGVGVLLSLAACSLLIQKTWIRWRSSTVITRYSITELVFPAVTICSEIKFDDNKLHYKELLKLLEKKKYSKENISTLEDICLVCPYMTAYKHGFMSYRPLNSNATDTLEKYALDENFFFVTIVWNGIFEYGGLTKIITEEGICYTFNAFPGNTIFENNTFHASRNYFEKNKNDWHQYGRKKKERKTENPFKVNGPGRSAGLQFYLKHLPIDEENVCSQSNGLMITVHNPADVPRPSQRGLRMPRGAVVDVVVTPDVVITDDNIRLSYNPSERQCFYPNERRLLFFKKYTQANCELECLANFTLRICDCVGFYMPRNFTTLVCTWYGSVQCMESADWAMRQVESNRPLGFDDRMVRQISEEEGKQMACHCLPLCNYLDFKAQLSYTNVIQSDNRSWEQLNLPVTLSIYFEDSTFVPSRRSEIYGIVEFIANCGGIVGLCMGLSMLSVVELIYCLLLRPCFVKCFGNRTSDVLPISIKNSHPNATLTMLSIIDR